MPFAEFVWFAAGAHIFLGEGIDYFGGYHLVHGSAA